MVYLLFIFGLLFADPNFNPLQEGNRDLIKTDGTIPDRVHCCENPNFDDGSRFDSDPNRMNGSLFNPEGVK